MVEKKVFQNDNDRQGIRKMLYSHERHMRIVNVLGDSGGSRSSEE